MVRRRLRILVVLAVLGLANVSSAQAETWDFETLWNHLRARISVLWLENGCSLDPDGRCSPQPLAPRAGDNGCSLDPSGLCNSARAPQTNGCSVDPDGRCAPAPVPRDNGCSVDPNGFCGS